MLTGRRPAPVAPVPATNAAALTTIAFLASVPQGVTPTHVSVRVIARCVDLALAPEIWRDDRDRAHRVVIAGQRPGVEAACGVTTTCRATGDPTVAIRVAVPPARRLTRVTPEMSAVDSSISKMTLPTRRSRAHLASAKRR